MATVNYFPAASGGTVTADAPLTGDGSSGNHLAISAATSSAAGSMAAADKGFIDGFESWRRTAVNRMLAVDAALNAFKHVNIGMRDLMDAPAVAIDASKEGGALSITAATSVKALTSVVTTSVKNNHWAIYFRGIITAPTSGHQVLFGMTDASFSANYAACGTRFAGSATKYEMELLSASTPTRTLGTAVADSLVHDYCLQCDATNVKFSVDGTVDITSAASNVGTTAGRVQIFNTNDNEIVVYEALIGYVRP